MKLWVQKYDKPKNIVREAIDERYTNEKNKRKIIRLPWKKN